MTNTTAQVAITLHASPAAVWEALTNPELVKQYMFGSTVVTDWKVGSPIVYRGEWQGKAYEDKGAILQIEPQQVIAMTYFSPMTGQQDIPQNYMKITYRITPNDKGVELTITQENNKDEASAKRSQENWHTILQGIKKIVEATT